jgi:iron complex outermembrane receptor protein
MFLTIIIAMLMARKYKRYPFFSIILLWLFCFAVFQLDAQVTVEIQSEDGNPVKPDSFVAYSSMGLIRSFSMREDRIVVEQDLRRIRVVQKNHLPLDILFPVDITSGMTVKLTLQPRSVFMDEFIISTDKTPSRLSRSAVSVSVLKPYLINNKITADMSTILEQMPGINISDGQVNIRNGSGWSYGAGSRVMVTLDELPMISPDAGQVQFAFLPVENLASVEVVKSAGSVLYGSSALNGVVNLRSAEPEKQDNARVSAFAGVYDYPRRDSLRWNKSRRGNHGINGFWSKKIGNTGITVQWNALYDQGYRNHEYNHRGRMGIRLKHTSAKIKGLNYGINSGVQQSNSGSFLLWKSYDRGYETFQDGYNYNEGFRIHLDPFAEWKRKKATHKFQARYLAIDNSVRANNAGTDQSNGSSLLYGEYRLSQHFQSLNIVIGAAGMLAETHSPLFGGNQTAGNQAAFFQADYKKGRWNLSGGGRYEMYAVNQNVYTKPVFRAGVNYAAGRATFLRASAGQGFRFPSMAELFVTTSVGPLTVYSNPNLQPESGNNAEIGIKQGYKIRRFRGFADLSVFQMELNNMMEFSFGQWDPNTLPGFKSVNVGIGRIRGIEFETVGDGQIGKTHWQLLGGYTYTRPQAVNPEYVYARDSAGLFLNFINTRNDSNNLMKYRYQHLVRVDVQCSYKKWESGISYRYNSRMTNIDGAFTRGILPIFITGIQASMNNAGVAHVFDWRLAFKPNQHWKINLQVNNVFNREYVGRPSDIRPPRSVQLQAVWTLR